MQVLPESTDSIAIDGMNFMYADSTKSAVYVKSAESVKSTKYMDFIEFCGFT